MRIKYAAKHFNEFEKFLGQYLVEQNSSELLAEYYKYAYAGKEHYGNDCSFLWIIHLAENVVEDFREKYLN